MNRLAILLLVALGGLGLGASPRRTVRVAVFAHAPAIFTGAGGRAQGFYVDILQEVANKADWELQFVPGTWQEGLDRVQRGELDLLTSVADTADRRKVLDFGQVPSFTVWSILYAHPGSGIQSILDVRDQRIGLMQGDVNGQHFRELCTSFNLPYTAIDFDSFPDLFAAIASGQVKAGVTSSTFGIAQEQHYKVERTPVVFHPFNLHFAVAKGHNRDLLNTLDAYLRLGREKSDSGYHRAINRWVLPQQAGGLPPWAWKTGLAILALLGLATAVAVTFRLRVRSATREIQALNADLRRELAERRLLEDTLLKVAEGVGASIGASFLNDLVQHLAEASGAAIAFVGELYQKGDEDHIRTLATFQDGAIAEPLEWPLADSTSARVLKQGLCVFPAGVQAAVPDDISLHKLGVESYIGHALRDSQGRLLGLVAVIDHRPMTNPELTTSLLRIFSARASAELERKLAEQERLVLERQMQHAQKLESLGVLAGGIAHDFNNLLTAMLGHMNVAQMKLAPESPAHPHLDSLERIIHRAADLTRQMLAYSGKGRFVVRSYDLNQVVQEVTHLLEVSISKKIALRFQLGAGLPLVEADAAQIQQVIMNLVTNAADAIGDREGTIRLTTGVLQVDRGYLDQVFQGQDLAAGTYTTLEVSDTGCGMTPEVQARIFEPFFTTKVAGRGLGLSATMGILKGHRSGMRIYSEPGRGTTFKLLFPMTDVLREEEREQISAPALVRKSTVLLVDDEEMIREAAQAVLESIGLTVITAQDGREAVEVVRREGAQVDVVLMDLTMPHMDGREAFQIIHRLQPHLPVILSSGYNEQESIQDFLGRGLAAFLQKPYTLRALELSVLEVLSKRHQV